ncbi:hypothetical protein [Halorubellus salinus]|uniref:hypothetical protein n=1 Tax=Halorubellus salinus TaxID=755309 RepID=UPI001D0832BE|nr:hypothetical protein [Halorubellus salinus]
MAILHHLGDLTEEEYVIKRAAEKLHRETNGEATIHTDHVDPRGTEDGDTLNVVDGIDGKPDLILKDFDYQSLLVEAETIEGIKNDQHHAIKQLNDFRQAGYKRVLLVPKRQTSEAEDWLKANTSKVENVDDVTVESAHSIPNLV